MQGRGTDHRMAPRYEEVERQYASLPRYCLLSPSLFLCEEIWKVNVSPQESLLSPLFSLRFSLWSLKLVCVSFPRVSGGLGLSQETHLILSPGNAHSDRGWKLIPDSPIITHFGLREFGISGFFFAVNFFYPQLQLHVVSQHVCILNR